MKKLLKKILAVGLAATMCLGMAVTVNAEEETPANVIWVNGKDIKANEDKGIEAAYNKTLTVEVSTLVTENEASEGEAKVGLNAELGEDNKYVISVTDDTVEAVADAYENGKGKKSDLAKASYKKGNAKKETVDSIQITAGKEAGNAVIWIAEVTKAKEIVAYATIDCTVKMAPKKFSVAATIDEEKFEKKATVNVGTAVALEVAFPENTEEPDAETTYTWTVKAPKGATEDVYTLDADGAAALFTANAMTTAAKTDKYTITCVNDQSQKKAKFTITVTNNLTDVNLGDIELETPADDKVVKELVWGEDYTASATFSYSAENGEVYSTTDKVKLYVAEIPEDGADIYTIEEEEGKAPKFQFTGDKSSALKAKLGKDGKITLTAKKGTVGGTQVQLIWVSTHTDKTIDVYTKIVTIGEAVEEEAPVEDPEAAE